MPQEQQQGKEQRLVNEYMDALDEHYCAVTSGDRAQVVLAKAKIDGVLGKMARIDIDEISYERAALPTHLNAQFAAIFGEQRA